MIKYGIKPNWEFFIRPLSCVKEYWNILKLILITQCAVIQRMVEQTSTIITLFFAFNLFASLPIWMNVLISLPQMTNMEEPNCPIKTTSYGSPWLITWSRALGTRAAKVVWATIELAFTGVWART